MNTAIKRALQILEYLTVESDREGEGVSTIGRRLDIPKSSAFDILESLTELGYVERSEGKNYRIGTASAYLGLKVMESHPFLSVTRKHLEELCRETGFAVMAGLEFGSNVVIADKISPEHGMPVAGGIGTVKPIHITALGKAILSGYSDERITAIVGSSCYISYTRNSIINPHQLLKNIRSIRKNGFAIENFEENDYIYGIAAPVFDCSGRVCESIGVSAFVHELKETDLDRLAQRVLACAERIGNELRAAE